MAVMFIRNNQNRNPGSTNENALTRRNERMQNQRNSQIRNGSIFAGNLNQKQDSFIQRKKLAMKKAMKVVSDAWAGEKKIDQDVAERRQSIQDNQQRMADNNKIIQGYKQQKEELRQAYGTELEGSLLEEYKQRAAEIDTSIAIYQEQINEAQKEISAESAAIRSIRLERLKTHTMVDAQDEAEEIKQAAGKEAIGTLVGEAQEYITEKYEKEREEAKEKAEEKEEQEEKLEEVREETELKQEELTLEQEQKRAQEETRQKKQEENAKEQEEILENAAAYSDGSIQDASLVQAEIKDMLHKMKLLEEDIKGAEVDIEL